MRKHSKQTSGWIQTCVFCKHKQSIKPQPRKILRHIRSPKRLRNSAKNPHKPDTQHNMTPTQLCSANGSGNQRVTHHTMLVQVIRGLMMLAILQFYIKSCVFFLTLSFAFFLVKYLYSFSHAKTLQSYYYSTTCVVQS